MDAKVASCTFDGTTSGEVAADLVLLPSLNSLEFASSEHRDDSDIIVMMQRLVARSAGRSGVVPLPILTLNIADDARLATLYQSLPSIYGLGRLTLVFFSFSRPFNIQEDSLYAALQHNGSLCSVEYGDCKSRFDEGQTKKPHFNEGQTKKLEAFQERNKRIPELVQGARFWKDASTAAASMVPDVFCAALDAPILARQAMLTAFLKWDRDEKGKNKTSPSDEPSKKKRKLV